MNTEKIKEHFELIKGTQIAEFSKLPSIKLTKVDPYPIAGISERSKRKIEALGETVEGARTYNVVVNIHKFDEDNNRVTLKKTKKKNHHL